MRIVPANITLSLKTTLTGHTAAIYGLVEDEQGLLYSAAGDGLLAAWNYAESSDGAAVARLHGQVFSLWKVPESPLLLAGDMLGSIHLINTESNGEIDQMATGHAIYAAIGLHDQWFVAGGYGYLHRLQPFSCRIEKSYQLSDRHVRCLVPYHDQLLCGCSDNYIYVFDLQKGRAVETLRGHTGSVFCIGLNPYAPHLISGGMDARLRLWDAATLSPLGLIEAHLYTINALAFHPTLPLLATASRDKTIRIWHAIDYTLLKVIQVDKYNGHLHSVNNLVWSTLNSCLISCSDDRTIKVWQIDINIAS